jgi:hypothetical protein
MYDDRPWWRRCIDIAVGTFLVLLAAVGAVVAAGFIIVFVAL